MSRDQRRATRLRAKAESTTFLAEAEACLSKARALEARGEELLRQTRATLHKFNQDAPMAAQGQCLDTMM